VITIRRSAPVRRQFLDLKLLRPEWGGFLSRPIGVFLLTGNRLLREALGRILRKKPDINVCGESGDFGDIPQTIVDSETDIVLMDPVPAFPLNLQFLSAVRCSRAHVQVLMVGMDEDEHMFLAAVRAGVAGYLLKDASPADVVDAIRAISEGKAVCPNRLCMVLFKAVACPQIPVPGVRLKNRTGLTRREQELVPLIARGFTNKEIASQLNLSEQTIKNHVHRMIRKVGAEDRFRVAEIADLQSSVA
jgi:DNA-binding NarL/FixJ family response regulator